MTKLSMLDEKFSNGFSSNFLNITSFYSVIFGAFAILLIIVLLITCSRFKREYGYKGRPLGRRSFARTILLKLSTINPQSSII